MWFRTLHSSNDAYFAWSVNQNGTISSSQNAYLVLGYGIAKNDEHWAALSNHYGWKYWKNIDGFSDEGITGNLKLED